MIRRYLALLALWSLAPAALGAAQLAIIIDDIGYNAVLGRRAADLQGAYTLAVLPLTPHTHELAVRGHRQGKEVMLHAPMSNTRDLPLGKGGLTSGMSRTEFITTLRASLADIPHLRGVNNHMGSQLTQEPEAMGWLMGELAERQLYFVDSRTSAQSQALNVARRYKIPSTKRDIFLDNTRDIEQIQQQLLKAIKLAQKSGSAIAIGHPYPETLAVLEQAEAVFTSHHVNLVSVSELLGAALTSSGKPAEYCHAPPQSLWHQALQPREPLDFEVLFNPWTNFGYQK